MCASPQSLAQREETPALALLNMAEEEGQEVIFTETRQQVLPQRGMWLRASNRYPKWNHSKWKHGPTPVFPWWFNFDPYPYPRSRYTVYLGVAEGRSTETLPECQVAMGRWNARQPL